MIAKLTSQPWLLASLLILHLNHHLTYAQDTDSSGTSTRLTQPGINPNCNKFVRANDGDTCYDAAMENGITLAQLALWNPALGINDGTDCPTRFFAGYDYCVGVDGAETSDSNSKTQAGTAADCSKFTRANAGDTCNDTAMKNGITLAQLIIWNPALGGPDGRDCPTKFLAGYDYCIGVNGAGTTNLTPSALEASSSSFTLEATNATFTALHNGTTHITALNGSFYIGVDPARYSPTAINVTSDGCASLAEESGGRAVFVSTSSGALSYAVEEGEITGETSERMEKRFRFVEGAFMRPGRGIFEFGVELQDKFAARGWEACPTEDLPGMEQILKVFAKGTERGKEGSEGKAATGEEGDCVKFLAVGTKTNGV